MLRMLCRSLKRGTESLCLCFLSLFVRRDQNRVAIGAWNGERYADNSRYLAEYMVAQRPDLKILWVGKGEIREEVRQGLPEAEFAEINTFGTNQKLLKCGYMFFSHFHNGDISNCNVYRKAVTCYLHHGMPVKKWGKDGLNQDNLPKNPLAKAYYHLIGTDLQYNWFVTSSPLHDRTNCTALADRGCREEKNLHSGTPRNDLFFRATETDILKMKEKYAGILGFGTEKRVLLYLPTYRRTETNVFSFSTLPEEQRGIIDGLLHRNNCVLIEKNHFTEKNRFKGNNSDCVLCVPAEMNAQELLLFADALISDYSGAFLDYLLQDRPILHYLYDHQYYRDMDSGLYYKPEEFCAGITAYSFDELVKGMEEILSGTDRYRDRRKAVREKFMSYEKGNASETIVSAVIGEHRGKP